MLRGIGLGTIWAERLEVGYTSLTLRSFMAGRTTLVTHYTWGRSHHGKSSSARLGASLIRDARLKDLSILETVSMIRENSLSARRAKK